MHSLASFIERAQASGRDGTCEEAFAAYCDVLTRLPGGVFALWGTARDATFAIPFYRKTASAALRAGNLSAANYFYECALLAAYMHHLPQDEAYTGLLWNAGHVRRALGDGKGALLLMEQALSIKRAWSGDNSLEIALDE
jgi:hypothetical protein